MDETTKYLIRARISADGVVERSDVVGAVFGQTEGLLGDELDLRDLQQSSKVGRIDVEVDSENGQSFGRLTIASSLDRVETAIVAASLETITRIGPCQARVEVTAIEDVREAKRRAVAERAKELLAESFDDPLTTSEDLLSEVREAVRVEDITEFHGLPAGPRVADSDAIVLVEGRSDVLTLLRYGVKNALGVEGTNVPGEVAELTQERTVTAFLDGDRGGELILRELLQVGDVDYVAFAPEGESVEDLSRSEVLSALRDKVPFDVLPDEGNIRAAVAGRDEHVPGDGASPEGGTPGDADEVSRGGTGASEAGPDGGPGLDVPSDAGDLGPEFRAGSSAGAGESPGVVKGSSGSGTGSGSGQSQGAEVDRAAWTGNGDPAGTAESGSSGEAAGAGDEYGVDGEATGTGAVGTDPDGDGSAGGVDGAEPEGPGDTDGEVGNGADAGRGDADDADADGDGEADADAGPETLREHVREVIAAGTGRVRLLDEGMDVLDERDIGEAFEAIRDAEAVPYAVVLDGEVSQRVLDVAAQRGVDHVVGDSTGEFVKQPVDVRVRTADQLAAA